MKSRHERAHEGDGGELFPFGPFVHLIDGVRQDPVGHPIMALSGIIAAEPGSPSLYIAQGVRPA
jgi:hypothetical protein